MPSRLSPVLTMEIVHPDTPHLLAGTLLEYSTRRAAIRLGGNFTKNQLGGPIQPAGVTVSTCALQKLLQYEPRDLTISVESGMPWRELERLLRENRQMIPLDPAWPNSTVGGVVAANVSGPRRRQYGTARDMIIGMRFATLEGKLVDSGGMVVKNVAGLDMAKLMIGSFGTLAAIASVNFKLFPMPEQARTFLFEFATAREAFAQRDQILGGVLQPTAIDIVNFPRGFRLLVEASGSAAVVDRFTRELGTAQIADNAIWSEISGFLAHFMAQNAHAKIRAISTRLTDMADAMNALEVPAVARAGSGVIYAYYAENAPDQGWTGDFTTMRKIKSMFDPDNLLNRGRLYDRI